MQRAGNVLAAALLVGGLAALALWAALAPGGPPYDPTAATPAGTRALVLLARSLGAETAVRGAAPDAADGEAWYVATISPFLMSDAFAEAIDGWVRGGGTLVVATREMPLALARTFGVTTFPGSVAIGRIAPDPLTADVRRIDPLRWSAVEGPGAALIEGTPVGARRPFFMVAQRVGAGQLVVIGDSDIFTNRRIGDADHAILTANLIAARRPGRVVVLDPYGRRHDAAASGTPGIAPERREGLGGLIRRSGAGLVLLQLAAALALWLVAQGSRFGPARPYQEPGARRLVGDYVAAMASLFRRTRARRRAAEALAGRWRREVLPRIGLGPAAAPEEIAARLAPDGERDAALRLLRLAAQPAAVRSDRDLIDLAAGLERLRRIAVDGARRGTHGADR